MITVIADDLTGACDTGALYAGQARVPVVLGDGLVSPHADVAVVDTETRALEPHAAAECVARTARTLGGRASQSLLFKKIDSTLRGPVGAELDALLSSTGHRTAIVCPAFPAQARTVVDGVLRVSGTLVHESPIGRDPAYPGPTSSVSEIVRHTTTRTVRLWRLAEVRGRRDAIVHDLDTAVDQVIIADAERDHDLDTIAEIALSRPRILLSGSAGLARALAKRRGYPDPYVSLPDGRAWLIVAGSLHPATRAQLRKLGATGVFGVDIDGSRPPQTNTLVAELEAGRPAFITTAHEHDVTPSAAAASRLATFAADIVARRRPDLLVVTGGDTALALLRALGANTIELCGVPASGLALGEITIGAQSPLPLMTKAGAFGTDDLFVNLLKGRA